jgi:hypothetical protein
VEWPTIINGLVGSSPVAGLLAFGLWKVWTRMEKKEADCARELAAKDEEIEEKDKQIQILNESRITDLKAMLRQDD